jgi:endonuclease YncB( thermonuclease family)
MIWLILLTTIAFGGVAQAADISGVPRVVDGDTLVVGDIKVRLEGIDAPETDQTCLIVWPINAAYGCGSRICASPSTRR